MNLLLAIFYSNFKIRFAQNIENNEEKRSIFLLKLFRKYDSNSKGYLSKEETYLFFLSIHNLIILKNKDIEPLG